MPRWEWFALVVLLAVHAGMNLPLLDRRPVVAIDECSYGDPGINLHLGHGFVSTCWYSQDVETLWSSNSPAYAWCLSKWFDGVGFDLYRTRLFGFVLTLSGFLIFYAAALRLKIIDSPVLRLMALAVLISTMETTLNARRARYDSIMIFAVSWLALAASIGPPLARRAALALSAATFAWCGLPLLSYVALLGILAFLIHPRKNFLDFVSVGIGAAVGLISLLLFFRSQGTLDVLLASLSPHTTAGGWSIGEFIKRDWRAIQLYFDIGPGLGLLLILSGLLWYSGFRRRDLIPDATSRFLLFAAVLTPIVLVATGKFIQDYNWMAIIPALAYVFRESDRQSNGFNGASPISSLAPKFASLLILFSVLYFVLGIKERQVRNYDLVREAVSPHVKPGDYVYCNWSAYYAIKEAGGWPIPGCYNAGYRAMVEFPVHAIPELPGDVRAKIALVAIEPKFAPKALEMLGGEWKRISSTPDAEPLEDSGARRLYAGGYRIVVYQRVPRE